MSEIEKHPEPANYYEGSWVGQFRAVSGDHARRFVQTVANVMEDMGVQDVGHSVREGSHSEFAADENARVRLAERVPQQVMHESVPHSEVRRQIKEAQQKYGVDDG